MAALSETDSASVKCGVVCPLPVALQDVLCDNFGARLLSAGWTEDNNCSTASWQQIMITLVARLEGEILDLLLH